MQWAASCKGLMQWAASCEEQPRARASCEGWPHARCCHVQRVTSCEACPCAWPCSCEVCPRARPALMQGAASYKAFSCARPLVQWKLHPHANPTLVQTPPSCNPPPRPLTPCSSTLSSVSGTVGEGSAKRSTCAPPPREQQLQEAPGGDPSPGSGGADVGGQCLLQH